MAQEKKAFHERVAEQLIEQLKKGTAPWQMPWNPGVSYMPYNPITGKRYKGINAVYLLSQGHSDSRWLTYKQAESEKWQVRKGEKSTPIQYWKFTETKFKKDEKGKTVLDAECKPVLVETKLERPRVFFATVFNASQIDGIPAETILANKWDSIERAELILKNSGADIKDNARGAYYQPSTDSIHLPARDRFKSAEGFYATSLHELGHWTGHASRLKRDLAHPFGSEGYAKEELRAEIFSLIIGTELNLGHDPEQHAAYVKSWIKAIQDDYFEIFRAAADAEKMQEYVLGLENTLEIDKNITYELENIIVAANGDIRNENTFISVPYIEKNEAKVLGAKWDKEKQLWYVPAGTDLSLFHKWEVIINPELEKLSHEFKYLEVAEAPNLVITNKRDEPESIIDELELKVEPKVKKRKIG